jgi:hypothetical protein
MSIILVYISRWGEFDEADLLYSRFTLGVTSCIMATPSLSFHVIRGFIRLRRKLRAPINPLGSLSTLYSLLQTLIRRPELARHFKHVRISAVGY